MTKRKTALSDATAKPCPKEGMIWQQGGQYCTVASTPRGDIFVHSFDKSVTRDAAQAAVAFFENDCQGWPEKLVIDPSWAVERIDFDDGLGGPAIIIASCDDLLALKAKWQIISADSNDLVAVVGDDPDFEARIKRDVENKLGVRIHPSWAAATLLDDDGDSAALLVSGPSTALVERAGIILAASFDIDLAGDSDEPFDDAYEKVKCCDPGEACDGCEKDEEAVDIDDEIASRKKAKLREDLSVSASAPTAEDKSLSELVDDYNQLGAAYISCARALMTGDDDVADRLALTLTELEVRIERLEMLAFKFEEAAAVDRAYRADLLSPETRAEIIYAIRDGKRNGRWS